MANQSRTTEEIDRPTTPSRVPAALPRAEGSLSVNHNQVYFLVHSRSETELVRGDCFSRCPEQDPQILYVHT